MGVVRWMEMLETVAAVVDMAGIIMGLVCEPAKRGAASLCAARDMHISSKSCTVSVESSSTLVHANLWRVDVARSGGCETWGM